MNYKFKFEKLKVWQDSITLSELILGHIRIFPAEEKFNLSQQLLRAADSVSLSIAEGSIRQSDDEQYRFIGYSIRSLAEVVTCLYKAKLRNYIEESVYNQLYENCYNLMNSLIAFQNSLNTKKSRIHPSSVLSPRSSVLK